MRLGNSPIRLAALIWLLLLPIQSPVAADEAALIDEFNGIVGKLNGGEFAETRKLLDAFEKTAKEVKAGDPAHKRAQDLLKQVPTLRLNSYHNSAIKAKNAADEAVQAVKLDEAAAHLKQFVADSVELVKLKPSDKSYQQQRTVAEQQLAQVEIVRGLLAGKPIDDKQLTAAAAEEPKQLYQSAPGFALPRVDRPQWVSPLAEPGQVVAIQVFRASHATAAFAAQTARALDQRYASRGLSIVSIAIDEGDDLAQLDAFIKTHKPTWPVLLDDRADFYQQYMQGGYYLPAYIVVGRGRQAWWINGASPLETTGMLAAKIHEEIARPADGIPAGPVDDFPPAVPFPATRVKDAAPATIRFGEKPTLMVVAFEPQDGPHWAELASIGKEYGGKLQTLAVVRADKSAPVRELAETHDLDLYQIRWGMPSIYGPNFNAKLVLVSHGGRVLKVAPLSNNGQHVRAVLAHYAALLTTSGAYPPAADAPLDSNLAHRLAGGVIEQVSSARQKGSQQRLNDGVSGADGWSPSGNLPQEATLSFLGKSRATFDRLTIDRRSGLGQFEVLVADDASGPFRSLGKFQADERETRQAFALAKTDASFVKLQFLSTAGERSRQVEIGEIEICEAAGVQPPLTQRLAATYAASDGIRADFENPGLAFWEQTDFVFGLGNVEWRVEDGHLAVSGMPQIGELRATALLHASPAIADFRLQAAVQSRGNQAGGIVFGFRDWDNHLRLVLVQGHVQTGRSAGNSIRLERLRQGRLEVLGVHGEAFPHGEPIRLEIQRQGEKVAVKAQDKVLFALDGVAAEAGRIGFCASGGGGFDVDEINLMPLAANAPWNVPPPSPLSTAAGASLVWLSSQGDDQHPEAWASNLLRNPIFAPPAAWEASRVGQDLPEAVFAFRDHAEVTVQGVEFQLPASTGAEAGNLARKVEVLAASDSPLAAGAFRTLGQFALEARSGPQKFALKAPAACRYLKLRLLENGGGEKFALARFDVQVDGNSLTSGPTADRQATGREEAQQQFATAADDVEQEPNDDVAAANPLRNAKSLDAAIHFGQSDFFRLPPPPAGKGLRTLRVALDALPWLRLKATLCDEGGAPLDPPLAQFAAGQHAEQTRPVAAGAKPPALLRVEMPAASLALILDTSGSMGGREEDVRAAVKSYLAGAAETERIEVIEFNTEVGVIGRLPDDREKVTEAIEQLGVRGNTALYEALLAGMERNQAVVLLSDGMNTVFKADFPDLCRRLGKQPVPIYVIGIGWDLHEYDANSGNTAYSLLSNLARQTGGQFYFSPESQQLEALYQQIAAEVRGQTRYRLRAEWEVSERTVELATIERRGSAHSRAFSLPLPPDLPELALGGGVRLGRGPKSAGMPPGGVDLAPVISHGRSPKPAIVSLPTFRESELASLPPRSIAGPRAALLPELIDLSVSYKPPKAGDPLLPPAVLPAFELIFDSSDSMKEPLENPKINVARKVMNDLTAALPADAQVGLRLYGHWGPWIARKADPMGAKVEWEDPRLNTDSDLVVPIGPVTARQRAELKRWIDWTQPRGKTPMVYSLLEARKDFSTDWKGPRTVILVSDGVETCGGKLEDLAKAYQGTGIDAVIHVVGFDIAGTDAEKQLREIAKIGRGDYYGAQNARQLSAALKAAAAAGAFTVYDDAGNVAARGTVNGGPVPLLPGTYRVRLSQVKAKELEISVTSGPPLRLNLREDGSLARP
ncbi:MAG TPA: VWA domain-containing protein [Pirellulaceae bacterium]|nr:VWA domain-containing protein [Pirellulaceae bacterium]